MASSREEYEDVRNNGGGPGKRRQVTELRESRKEKEPEIHREKSEGESSQSLLNFVIGSSLLITKAIMFFMPSKDHT